VRMWLENWFDWENRLTRGASRLASRTVRGSLRFAGQPRRLSLREFLFEHLR